VFHATRAEQGTHLGDGDVIDGDEVHGLWKAFRKNADSCVSNFDVASYCFAHELNDWRRGGMF
jgi:hypothetical protein